MVDKALFSSASGEWSTPQELFDELDREFDFELDPAASELNAKCCRYFDVDDDGLDQPWAPARVFINPPYGRGVGAWVKKAAEENKAGALVVMLLPARTDTAWFHEYIYGNAEIRFLRGRLKFGGASNPAPFPSMLAIFKRPQDLTDFDKLERCIRLVENKVNDARYRKRARNGKKKKT